MSALQGVFTLSEFHTRMLPDSAQQKAFVTPNAMDPHHFTIDTIPKRIETRFIYASAPNRGLEELLRIWPVIYERLEQREDVELVVYYGFTKAFMKWGKANMQNFETWMSNMRELLNQKGVRYVGMVDQSTLSRAYLESGFALYPTSFPETGCVALMKAQALGAIPVTSRYENSTLPELTMQWDLGPPAASGRIRDDPDRLLAFADAVVRAASGDCSLGGSNFVGKDCISRHRSSMMKYAQEKFRWSHVAKLWMSAIDSNVGWL
jgi:glycosyltransferase involved in cell wall biosynthesis